jgi:hypothetical protein
MEIGDISARAVALAWRFDRRPSRQGLCFSRSYFHILAVATDDMSEKELDKVRLEPAAGEDSGDLSDIDQGGISSGFESEISNLDDDDVEGEFPIGGFAL